LGFCIVAAAVYFGLQQRQPQAPMRDAVATTTASRSATTASPRTPPLLPPPVPPEEAFSYGTFTTTWRRHYKRSWTKCKTGSYFELPETIWYVEIPLELQMGTDGSVKSAERFDELRTVSSDGSHGQAELADDDRDALVACYVEYLQNNLRLAPSTDAAPFKMWVRVVDTTRPD